MQLREVSSLADVSIASWTPSTDPMRLPEIRHNLRLITEACRVDLEGLAREAKALEERKKWIAAEDPRLRRKVEDEAERKLIVILECMSFLTSGQSFKGYRLFILSWMISVRRRRRWTTPITSLLSKRFLS